jgi:minor extracellular serine protease Vpr
VRHRLVLLCALILTVAVAIPASAGRDRSSIRSTRSTRERTLPQGFRPAILSQHGTRRYFVALATPSAIATAASSRAGQQAAVADALASQTDALRQVRSLGGTVVFRYSRLVNGFSAEMSPEAANALAARDDVRFVEPVPAVERTLDSSVPFIGAPKVWHKLKAQGQGVTVAVVDTGVDYTHADFNGPGTVEAYESNDPTIIEPGTFPTNKVIGGYDFVGDNYSVVDDDPSNDIPNPDPDPLDDGTVGDHGTHVAGICCGVGVEGVIGKGVAPKAKILAVKVWDDGNSSADVLVAGYEFAMDPNQDGSMDDAVDVLQFSGGVDYGPPSSLEAEAAQAVVAAGTVFVASAGNSGNQPAGGPAYILGTPASAPGVIAVASSIDEFESQRLSVDDPAGVELPDGGPIVWQDWSAPLTEPLSGEVVDAREFDPPEDPLNPVPTDRMLCDETPPGTPFEGKIALIFKGPMGAGDCFVEDKVIHAQEAGAIAVIIWDGFGGLPSIIGTGGNEGQVTIPAVDLSGNDAAALAAVISPNAPDIYNEVAVTVTLGVDTEVIPGYADHMSTFSSEGPARLSSELKPDITAPGDSITSANAGTGDGALTIGGTSMAAPHVSGTAALLVQLHPDWSPKKIKAALMNQATQDVVNLDGSGPVPATVMGSGRVQAYESAKARSLAYPGSLSYGLVGASDLTTMVQSFTLQNLSDEKITYYLSSDVRYSDFRSSFASVAIAVKNEQLGPDAKVKLKPGKKATVHVEVTLDPSRVPGWQQEWGWYYVNPNVDGNVDILENGPGGDTFHVPWHVSALTVSDTDVKPSSLDLTGGDAALKVVNHGDGQIAADLYLLGAEDEVGDGGSPGDTEGDLVAIGARSFTGSTIDGTPEGVPGGADGLGGVGWLDFLTSSDTPAEPVEFVAVGDGTHNTTETTEVDLLVDVGADGVFADPELQADVMAVKLSDGGGGVVCVFQLPSDFSGCDAEYFADYSNYNADTWGIAIDAGVLGLSDDVHTLSYSISSCSGVYAGDVPDDFICDTAGDLDDATGTYTAFLDVTDPALTISPLTVGGFFGGGDGPATVSVGSAAPGDDPSILAVFPNNAPGDQYEIVSTTT